MCFMVPTTNRSPITVMTVVDVVGVRPKGHTSFGAPVGRQIVASAASGLSAHQIDAENVKIRQLEPECLFSY